MTISAFPFEELKKINTKELALERNMARLFPKEGQSTDMTRHLEDVFFKIVGMPIKLSFESRFDSNFDHFTKGLSDKTVCASIALAPSNKKMMVEVDTDAIFALVDRMLGGKGEVPKVLHPLTPLEEGVVQFFIARFLKEISQHWSNSPFKMRLDRILLKPEAVERLGDKTEPVLLATYRLRFNSMTSYVRLCLPHPVLSDWMKTSLSAPVESASDWPSKSIGTLRTLLWGEIGLVNLSAGEVKQLQRGDIILFDEFYPEYDGKKLNGPVRLRFGDDPFGGIDGELDSAGSENRVFLKNIFR